MEFSGQKLSTVEPHIFAISEAAFQQLNDNNNNGIDGKTNQSCIISGESGAGKVGSVVVVAEGSYCSKLEQEKYVPVCYICPYILKLLASVVAVCHLKGFWDQLVFRFKFYWQRGI